MLVGVEGHSWRPRHMQHSEVAGIVQSANAPTNDRTEGLLESAAIRDEFSQGVTDGQGRRLLADGLLTSAR